MQSKNIRHTLIALLAGLALLASCLFQSTAGAQETSERILMSAPFGLALDQSVRLTLFMPDGTSGLSHVKIFDSSGNPVAESAEVRISGGAFHSFHFEPGNIDLAGEEGTGRRQLQASCWIRVDGPWARMDDLSATLEIIQVSSGITDGTSNTIFFGERPRASQGDPFADFLIGIVPGQSLRFSVYNPEEPDSQAPRQGISVYSMKAWSANGEVIAVSRQLEILPRHFGWVSFDYSDLAMEAEPRTGRKQARFKPLFAFTAEDLSPSVQPILPPGTLLVSCEVVDNTTGKTLVGKYLIHSRLPSELP